MSKRLGVGLIGNGDHARVHVRAWRGMRDAEILGAWSADQSDAAHTAQLARERNAGAAKPYSSITALIADPAIEALWLCGPAAGRLEHMEEVADAVIRAAGKLVGLASEGPLATSAPEAQRITELAAHTGVKHGILEPLAFAPELTTGKAEAWAWGRPHTARVITPVPSGASEPVREAALGQALLVARFLVTESHSPLSSLQPRNVFSVPAADHGPGITVVYETPEGTEVVVTGATGRDGSVEVRSHGPTVAVAASAADGFRAQNEHYVRAFRGQEDPVFTFEDGFDVVRLLGTGFRSSVSPS